jgi:hypothetical protein
MARQQLTEVDGSPVVLTCCSSKYMTVQLAISYRNDTDVVQLPISSLDANVAAFVYANTSGKSSVNFPVEIDPIDGGVYRVRISPTVSEALGASLAKQSPTEATLVVVADIKKVMNNTLYSSGDALIFEFGFVVRRVK